MRNIFHFKPEKVITDLKFVGDWFSAIKNFFTLFSWGWYKTSLELKWDMSLTPKKNWTKYGYEINSILKFLIHVTHFLLFK